MKSIAVIQARMASKRLPGKALMKLDGLQLILHVIASGKKIQGIDEVILATSSNEENNELEKIARVTDIDVFRGAEEDVVGRFCAIANSKSADYIVRLTGDNPLHDSDIISSLLRNHIESKKDYTCITGLPVGTGADIFSRKAITLSAEKGDGNKMADSVEQYVLEHPNSFKILHLNVVPSLSHYRFSIDTKEDFERMQILFNTIGSKINDLSIPELIKEIHQKNLVEIACPKKIEISNANKYTEKLLSKLETKNVILDDYEMNRIKTDCHL